MHIACLFLFPTLFYFPFEEAIPESPQAPQNNLAHIDSNWSLKDDGKRISIYSRNRHFFSYNYALQNPPKGISDIYRRSGYIHPLLSPSGATLTDDFSDDHAHQHGLFFAIVKLKMKGQTYDFWNQHKRTANIRHAAILKKDVQKQILQVKLEHYTLAAEKDSSKPEADRSEQVVIEEIWTLRFFEQNETPVLEWTSNLVNITDQTVLVEKNHYGSLGVRGSGQWRKPEATKFQFETETGKSRANGNLSRQRWAAMQGFINGKPAGLAIIGSKSNFRSPQPVRLHPTMPYFSFAPMSLGSFELKPKQKFKSQFRLIGFDGETPRSLIKLLSDF